MSRFLLALVVLAGLPGAVQAARSYDNCTGFIDSLPATVTTPGTWCLRGDLATAQNSGAAVTVAASNVVIDCNDFRIDGLAARAGSYATGVAAREGSRHHVAVRHCAISGFRYGVALNGFSHLVEDNTITASTYVGIATRGENNVVRENLVRDTGGEVGIPTVFAISVLGGEGVVLGNTVLSVDGGAPGLQGGTYAYGVLLDRGVVQGNRLLNLVFIGIGVSVLNRGFIVDNLIKGDSPESGTGINASQSLCRNNIVTGWEINNFNCPAP